MEFFLFLELLVPMFDGCMCFLEMATLGFDASAAYNGVKTYKNRKKVAEKAAHQHGGAPLHKPSWWPFVVLLSVGLVFTALTVYKYTRPGR